MLKNKAKNEAFGIINSTYGCCVILLLFLSCLCIDKLISLTYNHLHWRGHRARAKVGDIPSFFLLTLFLHFIDFFNFLYIIYIKMVDNPFGYPIAFCANQSHLFFYGYFFAIDK